MPKNSHGGQTFGPNEGINLDPAHPPVVIAGIPVFTYGEYGGPGYTAGQYGVLATSAALYESVKPIDPLDALFKTHDMAYDPGISGLAALDPLAQARADVALIKGIDHIPNSQLDADAAIYGGLTTLVTIAKVELGPHPELLSSQQDFHFATDALYDIQRGLHDLSPAELAIAAPLVETAFHNIFSMFDLV
jgi:hypothetical protein